MPTYDYTSDACCLLDALEKARQRRIRNMDTIYLGDVLDRENRIFVYRDSIETLRNLLVAMMADILKLDQRDNKNAAQRIRTNSIRFEKKALVFRKVSMEMEKMR